MIQHPNKKSSSRKLDLFFEAVTFAEEGQVDEAKRIAEEVFKKSGAEATEIQADVVEKPGIFEAVAYAEAGLHSEAIGPRPLRGGEGRLLVVSDGRGFSEGLIENALSLAERMNLGIAALSIMPAPNRLKALFVDSPPTQEPENIALFRKKAEASALPFSHLSVADEPGRALSIARKAFRRIQFLMAEPRSVPEDRIRAAGIPVFYLADA